MYTELPKLFEFGTPYKYQCPKRLTTSATIPHDIIALYKCHLSILTFGALAWWMAPTKNFNPENSKNYINKGGCYSRYPSNTYSKYHANTYLSELRSNSYREYNSTLQSIAYLKLQHFSIVFAICAFHPKRTAPAWWPRFYQAK